MEKLLDCNLDDIVRLLITAPVVYLLIIFYIRILGKRSTSQLNNFDWIVTVSVGSIVTSTVIIKDISIFRISCLLGKWR